MSSVRVLTLAIACSIAVSGSAQNLRIYHVAVGQGDATLIVSPTGTTCLIDGGLPGAGSGIIVPLLNQLGIASLTYTIATHYHDDHYGGLTEVANAGFLPLIAAYDRGTTNQPSGEPLFNQYLAAVATRRATLAPGMVLDLGGGATLTCVGANGVAMNGGMIVVTGTSQEENARSIALKLAYGDFEESLTGDLTGGALGTANAEGIMAPLLGDVDVAKVNHHGALDSTSGGFAGALAPEVAVISCATSPFGFPAQGVLDILLAQPTIAAVYRLQQGSAAVGGITVNATLLIETNGVSYTCSGGAIVPLVRNVDESYPPPVILHAPLDVVISEYMADPAVVSDSTGEWIELRNNTPNALNLRGFALRDFGVDYYVLPTLSLPPFGRVVVGRSNNPANNGGYVANATWPSGTVSLGNTSDQIELISPQGVVLDAIAYDNGATYPDPTGASVERIDATAPATGSNFASATTPFGAGDLGTPGNLNGNDATPPIFTAQPAGAAVCGGATVSFSVTAGGTPPITYQWRKDGVPIGGATATTMQIAAAAPGDAGVYDCVASNAGGPRTSGGAPLAVSVPPIVTADPAATTVCAGNPATFSVTATGTAPLQYFWRKNGATIPGANASTYTIASAIAGHAGTYDCVVENGCGEVTTAGAALTILFVPEIVAEPAPQSACPADPVSFTVGAVSSSTPLTYQWRKDGVPIAGATASTFTIASVSPSDFAIYDVVVTNPCGAVTSAAAPLSTGAVSITTQPANEIACLGQAVTLSVGPVGAAPMTYQWRKQGAAIPGANGPVLVLPAATAATAGTYDVVIANACSQTTSNGAAVTLAGFALAATFPSEISALLPASAPVPLTITGSCFLPSAIVHANGTPLPTTFLDATTLQCTLGPDVPQALIAGGICINVQQAAGDVSNSVALAVGGGANAGTLRRHPLVVAPGGTYALMIEGGVPLAPLSLFADLGTVAPVPGFPDAVANFVLAVSPLTGSNGPFLTVLDGLGLFGPPSPTAFDATGVFVIPNIELPDPPLGIVATLQAVYLDASSPLGFRLTWARFPEEL